MCKFQNGDLQGDDFYLFSLQGWKHRQSRAWSRFKLLFNLSAWQEIAVYAVFQMLNQQRTQWCQSPTRPDRNPGCPTWSHATGPRSFFPGYPE
jgi:hypothetical protein